MLMLAGAGASGASSRGSAGNGGQWGVAVLGDGEQPLPSPREGRQAGGKPGPRDSAFACSGWGEVGGQMT